MEIATIIMWGILGSILVFGLFYYLNNEEKERKLLKEQYEEALKGDDRALALKLGQEYYSYLRNSGKLTIYDEQAITNDLSTMK